MPNSTGGALGLGYGLVLITRSGATYGGGTIHGITIPPAHINGCGDTHTYMAVHWDQELRMAGY